MANAKVIRDKLSASLEILEPGLTLIEIKHQLTDRLGAERFIDILARDRLGSLVVIVLKRSDQAARDTFAEILKYMPLFRRQHDLPTCRTRCFIVSTSWLGLLVPFAEFRRVSQARTEGFRIEADPAGAALSAARITDYAEDATIPLFRLHVYYPFRSDTDRQTVLPLIRKALTTAGAQGYLLFELDYNRAPTNIIFPFAAYIIPTRIEARLLASLTSTATASRLKADGKQPAAATVRDDIEDAFLCLVNELLGDYCNSTRIEFSAGSSDKIAAMLDKGWITSRVERVGPFSSTALLPEDELMELVKSSAGESAVRLSKMSSPRHSLDWLATKAAIAESLRGNPTWQAGCDWFRCKVEREFPTGTLRVQLYNPMLLPETLYCIAVTQNLDYLPSLVLTALPADDRPVEALLGAIVWDGKMMPHTVQEVFTEDLCGGITGYYLENALGSAWERDGELMRRHGLKYALWWITSGNDIEQARKMVVTAAGLADAGPQRPRIDSLTAYANAASPYLQRLRAEIDKFTKR